MVRAVGIRSWIKEQMRGAARKKVDFERTLEVAGLDGVLTDSN
jgi:hypothetical protein